MNCPSCKDSQVRRSRRNHLSDRFLAATGVVAWRCMACATRFYARVVPVQYILHAHCGICGNVELKKIAPEFVAGTGSFVGRLLRFQALRCEPCRHKFFSMRPMLREGSG